MTSERSRTGTPAKERKRQQRERDRALVYETEDWRLFCDWETLGQKAGCHPKHLRSVVLKELVDNALDAGADVTLDHDGKTWVVSDDGQGLDPADVPRLFAVNRPLLSTKLVRRPLRGMLGNGLRVVAGAVAATDGTLIVETRGRRLTLAVCHETGRTNVVTDEPVGKRRGLVVRLSLGQDRHSDRDLADDAITAAKHGKPYTGPSSPWWYGGGDLLRLLSRVTPADTTVSAVCRSSFGIEYHDERPARSLNRGGADTLLQILRASSHPIPPERLGAIGKDCWPEYPGYNREFNTFTNQAGARIPYIIEAWATCSRLPQKGKGEVEIALLLNRSMTVTEIAAFSDPGKIGLRGCDLNRYVPGPAAGDYNVVLSVIAPHIQLTSDGKEPSLTPFSEATAKVLAKACGAAHRAMSRPARRMSIKAAAAEVMPKAYQLASGNNAYPANARQIMYAARPDILRLTGKDELSDTYFTKTLLPDYLAEHPKETADWDVVYDARGSLVEPHTQRDLRLGTLEVREYLREYLRDRPPLAPAVQVVSSNLLSTSGPQHRFRTVLFIEKEGFDPLLRAARIAERFDIAIMSTKGTSVTAARQLLDGFVPQIDQVLVLRDFDVTGFSIFGTLGTDGRRYEFENDLPIRDLGLRLSDVEAMGLRPEPVKTTGDWDKRSDTLRRHGATAPEVAFLKEQRVELNAMTADVFVAFLERKLAEHDVGKLVPDLATLTHHARRVKAQESTQKLLQENEARIAAEAASAVLPADLAERVRDLLERRPELPWDRAVAAVVLGEDAA